MYIHESQLRVKIEAWEKQSRVFALMLLLVRIPVLLLDAFLTAVLLSVWLIFFLFPEKIIQKMKSSKALKKKNKVHVLFLSTEGFHFAPIRVRCYGFARALRQKGVQADTFSLFDDIFKFDRFLDRYMPKVEFAFGAIRAYYRLPKLQYTHIILQRPIYELVTAFAVRWIYGPQLMVDIDDWILDDPIVPGFKQRHLLTFLSSYIETCFVSSDQLEGALNQCFKRVIKLPTFVDRNFAPDILTDAKDCRLVRLGWNGTLFEAFTLENILLMIDAYARCMESYILRIESQLEVVGGGAYFPVLKQVVAEKYPKLPVVFRPWVSPDKMGEYVSNLSVGLYSLRQFDTQMPGFREDVNVFQASKSPTKLFEYMLCGVPVISTAFGEASHFIDHGKTGFFSDEISELAQYMEQLINQSELRRQMGEQARKTCLDRYTIDRNADMLMDVLQSPGE